MSRTAIARALSARFSLGDAQEPRRQLRTRPRAPSRSSRTPTASRASRASLTIRAAAASTSRFEIPASTLRGVSTLRFTGTAADTVDVVDADALARPRRRSSRRPTSSIERRPSAEIGRDDVSSRDQVDRPCRAQSRCAAGQALRTRRSDEAAVVQRNETVTLVYEVPGITLTVRGKAIEAGADGDVVGVLNEQVQAHRARRHRRARPRHPIARRARR